MAKGLERKSTVRLLSLISASINLQYLPPEIAKEEIPIISSKKSFLKLGWLDSMEFFKYRVRMAAMHEKK